MRIGLFLSRSFCNDPYARILHFEMNARRLANAKPRLFSMRIRNHVSRSGGFLRYLLNNRRVRTTVVFDVDTKLLFAIISSIYIILLFYLISFHGNTE